MRCITPWLAAIVLMAGASTAQAQRTFGTLVLVESEPVPSGPSPLSAERAAEWRFVELVYAPLYAPRNGGDAGFTPYLAKKVTPSADKRSFTVSLNDNAKWSVGRDVSPLDVVYTYELARRGKWNNAWTGLLRSLKKVRRSDDGFDVVFELSEPAPNPESLLVVPILPNGLHGPLDNPDRQRPLPLGIIGAGPYKLAKEGDPSRLIVNERALRKPRISEIKVVSAGSVRLALEYVRLIGDAVTFQVGPNAESVVAAEFGRRRTAGAPARIWTIGVAHKDTMMRDPVLRKAVRQAIDRRELFAGPAGGTPTAAPAHVRATVYPKGQRPRGGDVVEAQATLWWNGWQREPHQPFFVRAVEVKDSVEEAALTMLLDGDDPEAVRKASLIRHRLARAGIDLTLDARPRLEFQSRIRSREYPMALLTVSMPDPHAPDAASLRELFHTKGGENVLPGTDEALDRKIESGDVAGVVEHLAQSPRAIFLGVEAPLRGAVGKNVTAPVVRGRGGLERIDKWRVR